MTSTKKRLLSLLMAITMVVSMFPHVSFAASNDADPVKSGVETVQNQDKKEEKPDPAKNDAQKPDEKADEDAKKGDPAPAEQNEVPGNRDGETLTAEQIHQIMVEKAEEYYGTPPGENHKTKIEVSITQGDNFPANPMAGQEVQYKMPSSFQHH